MCYSVSFTHPPVSAPESTHSSSVDVFSILQRLHRNKHRINSRKELCRFHGWLSTVCWVYHLFSDFSLQRAEMFHAAVAATGDSDVGFTSRRKFDNFLYFIFKKSFNGVYQHAGRLMITNIGALLVTLYRPYYETKNI